MNGLDTQDSAGRAQQTPPDGERFGEAALTPLVDVIEDASGITLFADLPGVTKENLHLQIEAGTLTISAALNLALPQGLRSTHAEVELGRFQRTFTLSQELDPEKVSAEFNDGVLRLSIPKAEHAKPRRIEISKG
jgi:HSP20 family protein